MEHSQSPQKFIRKIINISGKRKILFKRLCRRKFKKFEGMSYLLSKILRLKRLEI